ncbi:hypothetical protein [Streptomyces sp. NPDC001880]
MATGASPNKSVTSAPGRQDDRFRTAPASARGRSLLDAAERSAAGTGVTLLAPDTESGSPAERLHRSAGWTECGSIPDYAADPAGVLKPTTLCYKAIGSAHAVPSR